MHDLDDGNIFGKWHECIISRDYLNLSDEDMKKVEAHKKRAWGGGAPIEANIDECPDLENLLEE